MVSKIPMPHTILEYKQSVEKALKNIEDKSNKH